MKLSATEVKPVKFPLTVKMVMIDLDGTLINTAPDLAMSVNRMLEDLGRAPIAVETIMSWIGNGVPRLVKRALTGDMWTEPPPAEFVRAEQLFKKHYSAHVADLSQPYPGVVAGLNRLQARGFNLACITNKAEAFTLPLLRKLDLDKYFFLVLSGDSLPRQKPDPLPLRHACKLFNITPDRGVLIGDSANDVEAARAAGMPVICVPYGYNHGHDIRSANPDAVVDSLLDVDKYLTLYTRA